MLLIRPACVICWLQGHPSRSTRALPSRCITVHTSRINYAVFHSSCQIHHSTASGRTHIALITIVRTSYQTIEMLFRNNPTNRGTPCNMVLFALANRALYSACGTSPRAHTLPRQQHLWIEAIWGEGLQNRGLSFHPDSCTLQQIGRTLLILRSINRRRQEKKQKTTSSTWAKK